MDVIKKLGYFLLTLDIFYRFIVEIPSKSSNDLERLKGKHGESISWDGEGYAKPKLTELKFLSPVKMNLVF